MNFQTPILFIIFNRPDTTQRVFDEIKKVKPSRLYVSADGPRAGRKDDEEKCKQTRAILEQVDWECEIVKNFSEVNKGCRNAVSSAITWYFSKVEEGIILEDDCLPHPHFFVYAEACLERYRNDMRVMHINGSNYQMGWKKNPEESYYFSRNNSIWGWASWRRAWAFYDVDMKLWPEVKKNQYHHVFALSKADAVNREQIFDLAYNKGIDTWDYQWSFAILANSGLSIVPNENLISNIGFGGEATHTTKMNKRANLPTHALTLPLTHPKFMIQDIESDTRLYKLYGKRGYTWQVKNFDKIWLKK